MDSYIRKVIEEISVGADGWDSLQHLKAIMETELSLGIRFPEGVLPDITSKTALYRESCNVVASTAKKKLVVVDLDGTLWGGVLGEGTACVEPSHRKLHRLLYDFQQSGVLLSISSKNEHEDAAAFLDKNCAPLRINHFFLPQICWNPKPESILIISQESGCGLESIVFIDDSLYEREIVCVSLPTVKCLPPSLEEIMKLQFCTSDTAEDSTRLAAMVTNQRRDAAKSVCSSESEYLRDLNQVVCFSDVRRYPERAAQLIERVNQFNVTMQRPDIENVLRCLESGAAVGVLMSLRDRFGDSGVVGLAVAKRVQPSYWGLWICVLSCRALGRGAELCLLSEIRRLVEGKLFSNLKEGPRNSPARTFLERVGGTHEIPEILFPEYIRKELSKCT